MHYRAEAGQDYSLSGDGVLLLDSGAHYRCGTTDITRTFYFSEVGQPADAELVRKASLVLAAHCQLALAVFPAIQTGFSLMRSADPRSGQRARFCHGTGHGVGHILNVHEGPVSISKRGQIVLKKGISCQMSRAIMKKGSLAFAMKRWCMSQLPMRGI